MKTEKYNCTNLQSTTGKKNIDDAYENIDNIEIKCSKLILEINEHLSIKEKTNVNVDKGTMEQNYTENVCENYDFE